MLYDLIIIGGGPAGITAGIYAARQKLNTLLITREFGGQMVRKSVMIENYPGFEEISGLELLQKFEKQLRKQKIDIERDEVVKIVKVNEKFIITTTSKNKFESKTIIIASGADPRPLEVPGEKEFIGKGVGYCVTCDGPLFEGKNVAIIGGGNSGFEAAIFMSKIAKKVYIMEYGDIIKADQENRDIVAKLGNIEAMTSVKILEIQGDKFVREIIYQDKQAKKNVSLAVEGIFIEIGSQPATAFAKGLVDLNSKDEIVVDLATLATKTPGLFAAGDANIGKVKQIATAVGGGTQAALAVAGYLKNLQ